MSRRSSAMGVRRISVWSVFCLLIGLGTCLECPTSDEESILQKDHTYTYRFRSEALTQAVGTTEDHGRIEIECEANIEHDTRCSYVLRLGECVVTAAGGSPGTQTAWMDRTPMPELERYPVEFSLSNGEIIELRAHEEDPLAYLNIKRGVLSAFVFKISQIHREVQESHTDVQGTCPMTSLPEPGEGKVKTSKDMLRCHFPSRPDWQFSPWSLFWNMSFIQHVINSTTECVYDVDGARKSLDHVTCRERHAIMLESTHRTTTAVQTNVHYRLHLLSSETQAAKPSSLVPSRRTGIQYEYDETPAPETGPPEFLSVARGMLSRLVSDSTDEVRLFTVPQFTDFVAWLRSSPDLRPLVDSVGDCEFLQEKLECDEVVKDLARSYLSDALFQCNTVPCARALAHMAGNEQLSPAYLHYLYYFWSYTYHSKPGFVANFADMCRAKNSHHCWMSLGSFMRRTLAKYDNLDEKVLEEMKIVAAYYDERIGEDCRGDKERFEDCFAFIKASSNTGRYYSTLVPGGVDRLLDIAAHERALTVVRTAALQALKEICDPENLEQTLVVYDRLLPVFENRTLPPSARLLSFDLLVHSSRDRPFEEHLLRVLKEEGSPEVKYYVADRLDSLRSDVEFGAKRGKFIQSLNDLLREKHLSLEWIVYETKGKSKSSSHGVFFHLPFLPDLMKRFGLKIQDSSIYDSHVLPSVFDEKAIFQLFGTFLPATQFGTYLEGFEGLLQAYQKNLREMDGKPASLSKTLEALLTTVEEWGSNMMPEGSLQNFDENILSNVKKIRDLYWAHHEKLTPYIKAYFDVFGSTAKYFVFDGKRSTSYDNKLGSFVHSLMQTLAEGVTYNATRVVRVIEAYHQVPTLMGLPLNWTTNATLAFSVRTHLKYHWNAQEGHVHSKGVLRPSAALTFLNRMVLDFPTVTRIGVQANSSAYTSTDFKGQYTSSKGKQTLRLDRPTRTQKVLQLFRTNQLIKHDRTEDIPDWNVERVSSSWCTKQDVNSAGGLRFCLSKSYPNVTHRLKPWALMAGWCKWEFLVHPNDPQSVHYDLELHQGTKHKLKEWDAKFSMKEREKEKSGSFKATLDEDGKDLRLELKTSLVPEFSASLSRSELTWKKHTSGRKIKGALVLFEGVRYGFELTSEAKVQRPSGKTSSHGDEDSQVVITEEKLSVDTPYSAYLWNKTVHKVGENVKADAYLSYENLKSDKDWMKKFLPPSFWEDDRRASLKVQLHWKKPVQADQGTVTRQTNFRMDIPRYVMTLDGADFESKTKSQLYVNLARRDKNRGTLDSFLNFTSDWWSNEDKETLEKEVRVWNVTIPRRSWAVLYQRLREGRKYHHEVALRRALMKPKDQPKSDYVGWWSEDSRDRFDLEEKEVKLSADNEWLTLSNEELLEKYPSLTGQDLEGLRSGLLVSDLVLHYPFGTDTETVAFDGHFIYSTGPTTFRFQKDFDMTSSYNNLKLTSHSVYRSGTEGTVLDHSSHFAHLRTQAKAHNTIHFTSRRSGKCRHLTFEHDIRSEAFDLSTDAVYRCEREDEELYTLRLTIDTNSSKWNMLDMKLDQIVEDVSREYSREEMTATHATGTIHVDAEWHKHPKRHQKKVVLCSKDGQCPNAELFLEFSHDGRSVAKFSLPNRNDTQITYEKTLSDDYKNLDVKIGYFDRQTGLSELLDFTGYVIARNYQIFKGALNAKAYAKVRDLVASGYQTFEDTLYQIAKDENHPLNDILRPALKVTVYEYWGYLKEQARSFLSTSWDEACEIFYTVEAFAEPAYNVLVNTLANVHEACRTLYDSAKDKSVTIWAIHYFDLPHYVHQGVTNLPHAVGEIFHQLALGEEDVLHFKFVTGKILSLASFVEWPSISFYPPPLKRLVSFHTEGVGRSLPELWSGDHSLALVFGPHHVYTFDGHLYDVPAYPSGECLYLLAHDVHGSLFTVLSSEGAVHLLFPEMSVTIDEHDEVFVNGSGRPAPLPLQTSNGKVTVKRGDGGVEVWSPSLSVICRSRDFLCVLRLSEFHSGGIVGLLGDADGHPHNEYQLPTGNASSGLSGFLRTYEVSGHPRCRDVTVRAAPAPSEEERRACLHEFGNTCAFQYQVRDRFVGACASDVRQDQGLCYAASALAALCHLKYQPSHTACNAKTPDKESIGRHLEVVLVVQESKYLTSSDRNTTPDKGVESLVAALDQKFRESGYDSVRYALVGFGGNGVRYLPTVHSTNKDVWVSDSSAVVDLLKTLEFKSREDSDAVGALRYALDELGLDTFRSKVFVVVAAKDKQVAEKPVLDYIQKRLDKNGITLYALSSYPSIEKGKKVFGVRSDGLIFPGQSKEGDEYLDYPRGNLAKLASSTRGSVFLSKFVRDNQPQAFFAEFAQEVWAKVNREAQKCRRCRLVPSAFWWYRQECSIVRC